MVADFFTKPLQGTLFRILREVIMGRASVDLLDIPEAPSPQECVEENTKVDVRAPSGVPRTTSGGTDPPSTYGGTDPPSTYASILKNGRYGSGER